MTALLLRGLRATVADEERRLDVRVRRGRISELADQLEPRRREKVLQLGESRLLPGLINAHDHLDLDLLPALGSPPYTSFYDWAEDIYRPEESPIADMLRVPAPLRIAWGAYRNLISGVTTAIHHGDLPRRPLSLPVEVLRRYGWSHSLGFSERLERDFRRAKGKAFFVHAAEGTDPRAEQELETLDRLGLLANNTVLIHAMASHQHLERLATLGTSVVWCPSSNERLYGATAPIDQMLGRLPIALGTDSTLSGDATLFDELRAAHRTGLVAEQDLVPMVTHGAARIAGLTDRGELRVGAAANLVVLGSEADSEASSLLAANPVDIRLVLVRGQARLAEPELAEELGLGPANARVDGQARWLIGRLGRLRREIQRAGGEQITRGPLWGRMTVL